MLLQMKEGGRKVRGDAIANETQNSPKVAGQEDNPRSNHLVL